MISEEGRERREDKMDSTHVICITNEEAEVAPVQKVEKKRFQCFSLPSIICRLRDKKIHCSLIAPITASLADKKKKQDTRKIIHSIKVAISLVLVSLLYLLDPLYNYNDVGENTMWAIMTVVVVFEFYAGATLGKGLNRGMGTILGGGLGCLAALFAHKVGGIGCSVIIATCVFVFGAAATYLRQVPQIKKRYDYGVMIFMLTFNLVVVSGVRAERVFEIARQRLLTILVGFILCICVSLFLFPLWASDELHYSTVSKFQDLATTIQGCLEEYVKFDSEKEENKPAATLTACKSVLNSKSCDESLANFARWEPWHGRFGFSYPWEKYLKIGEVLREVAAITISLAGCLHSSKQLSTCMRHQVQQECEAIGTSLAESMRELGEGIKGMRRCQAESQILPKLNVVRVELSLLVSPFNIALAAIENKEDGLAIASFVLLLTQVLEKIEQLTKEVGELGELAGFHT